MFQVGYQLIAHAPASNGTYKATLTCGDRVFVTGPHPHCSSGLTYYRVKDEPRWVFAGHVKSLRPVSRIDWLNWWSAACAWCKRTFSNLLRYSVTPVPSN
ncbi:hypothetical protein GCM10011410_04990 [Hoyosella rhizosphaerae]|uniref:Uncharacterized protein n=1 Tax=Hoyosella rhizosphaerae TaxID=1755582 RepID=A0A916U278_9ACTN|nr:hypothetical protein GCM10011410_04990 [Hoyosella rhizosphaerae]